VIRRLIAILVILSIVVLAAGSTALLYSATALQWAFARVQGHLPAGLTVEHVEGRLAGPLTLAGLRYESDSVLVRADSVALRWRPGRLFDGVLDVDTLTIRGLDITTREGVQQHPGTAPDVTLPFPIKLRRLEAATVVLRRPGYEPMTVTALDLSASARQGTVTLSSLHLASPQLTLAAGGKLPLNPRDPVHLNLDWQAALQEWTVTGSGTLGGTWPHLTGELRTTQPLALTAAVEIDTGIDAGVASRKDSGNEQQDTAPRWRLRAAAEPFVLSTLLPRAPAARISDAALQAAGSSDAFTADIGLTWDDAHYGRWAVTASAAQNAGRWDLPRFHLRSAIGTDVSGHAQAQLEEGELRSFLVEADWRDLAWPPAPGGRVLSPRGTLHVRGDAARYDFTLTGELQPPPAALPLATPLPPLPLTLTGHGDRAGLDVDTLAGAWLAGTWSGHGAFTWSPAPRWDFALHAEHVDPGRLREDFSGNLAADMRVRGEYAAAGLTLGLEVEQLSGTLRDHPLSAHTQIALQPGVIRIDDLQLQSGTATLAAHARLGTEWQLEWQLRAPALAELVPGLTGSLQGQGRVDGPPAALRTRVDLAARQLSYRDLYAGALQAHADIDAAPAGRWEIRAGATGTGRPDRHQGHLTLQGGGTSQDHTLQLAGEQDGYRYEQALSGTLHGRQWQARLHDGRLDLAALGPFAQEDAAVLTADPDGYTLTGWCWRQEAARVCLQGSGHPPAAAQGDVRWQQLDVARLAALLPDSVTALKDADIELGGTSSGELHVSIAAAALQALSLSFDVTAGTVSYTLPFAATQRHTLNYRQATMKIQTQDDGLHADLAVDIGDGERLNADLRLPQWDPAAPAFSPQQALAGEVGLSLNDLSAIALLLPDMLPGPGRVQTHFTLSGTLGEPQVDGRLDASLETVDIARLGIRLRDINLHAQMEQERWRLQGDLLSGTGKLAFTGNGSVPNDGAWEATLALSGQDVEAMRLPVATIIAAPDLTLHFVPGELAVAGTLVIPRAQLEPFKGEAAAAVSDDVVIIGGENRAPSPRLHLRGDVVLVLGDEVRLAGKGLAGRLTGRAHILMDGLDDIRGQGEIRLVEGRYKAYGQDLSIEQGRLLYAGGPIEDPALDLVASRQRESSEGDKIKVGVRVAGTVQRPLVLLFSDPAMDDGDVLAYLVLGHPLNKASASEGQALYQAATSIALVGGEALASRIGGLFDLNEVSIESGETSTDTALVLGKSLSPRIYIRYLQGLVENTSAFQIRYQLNDNWTLQTESGTRSGSGADLIYSIER
jgi:translocation and assembly module TamB